MKYKKAKLELTGSKYIQGRKLKILEEGSMHCFIHEVKLTVDNIPVLIRGYQLNSDLANRRLFALVELELAQLKINGRVVFPEK